MPSGTDGDPMSHPTDLNQQGLPTTKVSVNRPTLMAALVRGVVPVAVLMAGCAAYSILSLGSEEAKDPPVAEQALRTKVTELRVRDYPVVVRTHGVVQPHNEVTLSAQIAGEIRKVSPSFETGSYFSAGETLIELDSKDYEIALAVADARRLGAEAALRLAALEHERSLKLLRQKVVTQAEFDQTSATHAQAVAEADSAKAQLERAQRDLERTKVLAPFDGRVRRKAVGLGQTVAPGTPLGEIFAIDFAEVRLPIAGRELPFLELPEAAGDAPVAVELRDGINEAGESIWKAQIVRTEGNLDKDSLELFAIARVEDPFGRASGLPPLRIGQPVVASLVGKTLTGVVALPRAAVRRLDQVFLVDKVQKTLQAKTITPIWSDDAYVIVRDAAI